MTLPTRSSGPADNDSFQNPLQIARENVDRSRGLEANRRMIEQAENAATNAGTNDDVHRNEDEQHGFKCPVCSEILGSVPTTTDLRKKCSDVVARALRSHCDAEHKSEYLWVACRMLDVACDTMEGQTVFGRDKSKRATVKGMLRFALRKAATDTPLPEDDEFLEDWEDVKTEMCSRIGAAHWVVKHESDPYFFKKKKAAVPADGIIKEVAFDREQRKFIKTESLSYLMELWVKVFHAHLPVKMMVTDCKLMKMRQRNWIELFFWAELGHRDHTLIGGLPSSLYFPSSEPSVARQNKNVEQFNKMNVWGQEIDLVAEIDPTEVTAEEEGGSSPISQSSPSVLTCPVCGMVIDSLPADTNLNLPILTADRRQKIFDLHYEKFSQIHANEPLWNRLPQRCQNAERNVESWIRYCLKHGATGIKIYALGINNEANRWKSTKRILINGLNYAKLHASDPNNYRKNWKVPEPDFEQHITTWRVWIELATKNYMASLIEIVRKANAPVGWDNLRISRIVNRIHLFFLQENGHLSCGLIDTTSLPPIPQFPYQTIHLSLEMNSSKRGRPTKAKVAFLKMNLSADASTSANEPEPRGQPKATEDERPKKATKTNASQDMRTAFTAPDEPEPRGQPESAEDANIPSIGVGDKVWVRGGMRCLFGNQLKAHLLDVIAVDCIQGTITLQNEWTFGSGDQIGLQLRQKKNKAEEPEVHWDNVSRFHLIAGRQSTRKSRRFAAQKARILAKHETSEEAFFREAASIPEVALID